MQACATVLTTESIGTFTTTNDCLVLFHKSRCPNCKVMFKVLEKSQQQQPNMVFVSVSIETEPDLAAELEIGRVPTVVIYRNGKPVGKRSGVLRPAELVAWYNNS